MGDKEERTEVVYTFTREKLEEFKDMTPSQKLLWLEETNLFISRTLGFSQRSIMDERFKDLPMF